MIPIQKLNPNAKTPSYAHTGDAGMDLYSCEKVLLQPQDRKLVATGIAMAIPSGYVGLIWDKSGIARKGVKTMGGVIDASFRGEIKVIMLNLSKDVYTIEAGDKIAQMLIQEVKQKKIIEVKDLEKTERGEGGFGSTGLR